MTALRRVIDDPAADPDDDPSVVGYLSTITGRERALNVSASLGLVTTVRRDWWEVIDPVGGATGIGFPQGRRIERQAALALLAELPHRTPSDTPLLVEEIVALLTRVREQLPRWAASYGGRLDLLARAAAEELVAAALLVPADVPDRWHPTPGVHLWRVRVGHGEPTARVAGDGRRASQQDERSANDEDLP
jgi:hypothetical protein